MCSCSHLMCQTLLNELKVTVDILLVRPWHKQLCAHWNAGTKIWQLLQTLMCSSCPLVLAKTASRFQHFTLTFTHDAGELSRDVTFRNGRGWRVSIAGRRVVCLEALWGWVFVHSRFCGLCRGSSSVLQSLSCRGRTVGFYRRDDDLLQLLKGISQVSPFQNILQWNDSVSVAYCGLLRVSSQEK